MAHSYTLRLREAQAQALEHLSQTAEENTEIFTDPGYTLQWRTNAALVLDH